MDDQYGMADLRQYMTGRPLFPPPDLLSSHRSLTPAQHYEMVLMGRQVSHDMVPAPPGLHHEFRPDVAATSASLSSAAGFCGLEMEASGLGAADGGTGRWPRQETLTLLEIRSRLDPKFKEANQKGPLWDEVSRIMSEEHGYQRSGKKCREKFENLYKYYKKTKEGKAGRQDGKHYRFFRQLEALYGGGGETSNIAASVSENHHPVGSGYRYTSAANNNATAAAVSNQELFQAPKPSSDSLSLSNSSSDFDSNSSEEDSDLNATVDNHSSERRRRRSSKREGRKTWKAKIRDFIDSQMRKIMEKQEAWLEKMMRAMEQKEQERVLREEEWRKQEADRIDREHKFWANERAWIEARDATLMETLRKLTGKEIKPQNNSPPWGRKNQNDVGGNNINETIMSCSHLKTDSWSEFETTRLIQLRTSMDPRFQQQLGCPEQVLLLWEEIAAKMACLGYQRNALMCKDKWDGISSYLIKCTKKRKENSRMCSYLTNDSINSQGGGAYSSDTTTTDQGPETVRNPQNDQGASPPNSDTAGPEPSYRFMISDTENLWENYGMKFSKGENH